MVVSIFIPAVVLGFIVFIVAGLKSKDENEEEGISMLKNIYHYLVLFATLMMVIGGSVGAFMSIADLVSPTPYYQSYEEFKQTYFDIDMRENGGNKTPAKSEDELRVEYDSMVEHEKERVKQSAINSLIKSFGWIIIPLPIFIYFQRQLRKKE